VEDNNSRDAHPSNDHKVQDSEQFQIQDVPRIAVESANIGTWLMDMATKAFFPSDRTKEIYGFYQDEPMSFETSMVQVTEKHRQRVTDSINYALTNHAQFYMEYQIVGFHDQQERWVRVLGGFNGTGNATTHFSGVIMDITEQKQAELRKSKFIGMVSHELKTPLTALKAYVQMLNIWAKKQKDNFSIGTLSKVEKQIKKMNNMIAGFLNLSGAESGKIHLTKQDFSLDGLIKEVLEEAQFISSADNVTFSPCEEITVNADRDKIEQVIVNLLSNAVKYSGKGAPIAIYCEQVENMVQVSIKDEGMGVKPEDIEKLFEAHYRVETKETQNISGFGIGLYLSSEIIKRHNGKIWVQSKPGMGSTFKFTLPLK